MKKAIVVMLSLQESHSIHVNIREGARGEETQEMKKKREEEEERGGKEE